LIEQPPSIIILHSEIKKRLSQNEMASFHFFDILFRRWVQDPVQDHLIFGFVVVGEV